MYYGKQRGADNNYYNEYRNSSYQTNDETDYLAITLKLLIIILLLGLLFIGYLFITKEAKIDNTIVIEQIEVPKKEIIKDVSEEKKIVENSNKKTQKSLTSEEIASIVKVVMSKMNDSKEIDSKNKKIDDDIYTKKLLSQDVDLIDGINKKKIAKNSVSLKDTDYYNKVVISSPKNETYSNDSLSQLSSEIGNIIDSSEFEEDSSYTEEITKEVEVRSGEMRFIVVQEGDTLGQIAYRAYGNYDDYEKIYQSNPEVLFNPDQIYPGQRLRIPI